MKRVVRKSKYTQTQRAEALTLYETHGPSAVENQLSIPKSTVMSWAKKANIRTVRNEATRAAVEARVADGKLRRVAIIERMYTRAEFLLTRLEADTFEALVPSAPGVQSAATLLFVPAAEERQLAASMSSYLTGAEKLEKVDADDGVQAAESMLGKLVAGIGVPDE